MWVTQLVDQEMRTLMLLFILTGIVGCQSEPISNNSEQDSKTIATNTTTKSSSPPPSKAAQAPPNRQPHPSNQPPGAPQQGMPQQGLPPMDGHAHMPPPGQPMKPPPGQPMQPPQGTPNRVGTGAMVSTKKAPTDIKSSSKKSLCPDCDIILISICSLRKDHVGIYGKYPNITPRIDELAKNGYYFEKAYAASNFTLAGITAILTARFGSSTGVTGWDKGLTLDVPTLPEVLGYYGYQTAAFTINAASGFRPDYGLDRGFQRMELTHAPRNTPDGRWQDSTGEVKEEGDGASALPVTRWLETASTDKPVFIMHHNRTAHFPFVISDKGADEDKTGMIKTLWEAGHSQRAKGNKPVAMPGSAGGTSVKGVVDFGGGDPVQALVNKVGESAIEVFRAEYRKGVSRMDKDIGAIIDAQKKRGRFDKTVWIVVADHGESLNDHNELLHGARFYDSVINVPLLVKIPGLKGNKKALPSLVSHVDIMPTLLDLVGAVKPADIDGASMLPLLRGKTDKIRNIALSEGGVAIPKGEMPGAIIALPWTLLFHEGGCNVSMHEELPRRPGETARCLYNLENDPYQEKMIARQNENKIKELNNIWKSFQKNRAKAREMNLDPEFVKELQKTGYDFRSKPK